MDEDMRSREAPRSVDLLKRLKVLQHKEPKNGHDAAGRVQVDVWEICGLVAREGNLEEPPWALSSYFSRLVSHPQTSKLVLHGIDPSSLWVIFQFLTIKDHLVIDINSS